MRFQLVKIYIATGILFFTIRVLNFLIYGDKAYNKLKTVDALLAFLHGFKFDFSVIFTFYGLPTLLLLVPWPKRRLAQVPVFFSFLCIVLLVNVFLFTLVADLFYFNQVKRHVVDEWLMLWGEWAFIFDTIFRGYAFQFLAYLVFALLLAKVLMRVFLRDFRYQKNWRSFSFFLVLAILVIRGGVGLKPISTVDAFAYGGSQGGQLALNGVFSAWHASRNTDKMNYPQVDEVALRQLAVKLELDVENKFSRQYARYPLGAKTPNIVIVLLESWSNAYIKSFGSKDYDVTPQFDALAEQGIKYTNFYATGSRSIEAIQSILTSFPSLKGLPTLGLGFELMKTAELGALAGERGYETYFFQSAKRESFRLNAVAAAYGFEKYYGSEDYPKIMYPDKKEPAFGWDYEMYMHALSELSKASKPFLGFMFTGTTHTPFVKLERHAFSVQHGPENEFGFLNSLNYADWALGEFIDRAKSEAWFDNTVFIFTADHSLQTFRKFSFREGFQVPLLIYAPKLFKAKVDMSYAGHLDILPTVLHLVGTNDVVPTVGRSLFYPYRYRYALLSGRYANPGWLDAKGYMVSDLEKVLDQEYSADCDSACVERRFLWLRTLNAYLYESIDNNTWRPGN